MAIVYGHHTDGRFFGLLDRHTHRIRRGHVPESPVPVHHCSRRRLLLDKSLRTRLDLPFLEPLHILGNANHAVRIVTQQIGLHQ